MLRFAAQRRHFSAREGESEMQKKNNKGIIALIIVLVLAAAALVIWQTNKRETQQGGKEITVNVDHRTARPPTRVSSSGGATA